MLFLATAARVAADCTEIFFNSASPSFNLFFNVAALNTALTRALTRALVHALASAPTHARFVFKEWDTGWPRAYRRWSSRPARAAGAGAGDGMCRPRASGRRAR